MIWGANPSQVTNPIGRKACPEVAKDMAEILKPAYRFGPAPKYTKVDHATGWLKSVAKNVWPPPVPSTGNKNTGNKLNAKAPPRGHLMLLSSDEAAARGPTRPCPQRLTRSFEIFIESWWGRVHTYATDCVACSMLCSLTYRFDRQK